MGEMGLQCLSLNYKKDDVYLQFYDYRKYACCTSLKLVKPM